MIQPEVINKYFTQKVIAAIFTNKDKNVRFYLNHDSMPTYEN